MIDMSDVSAQINDEVILLGNYPEITAQDIAQRSNTINYEIVTRINPLLPRISV
jgi:alanine racemase